MHHYVGAVILACMGVWMWAFFNRFMFDRPHKGQGPIDFAISKLIFNALAGGVFLAAVWLAHLGSTPGWKLAIRLTVLGIPPATAAVQLLWHNRAIIHLRFTNP